MIRKALKTAFPQTIPVLTGYVFLGMTYGILMVTSGFPVWLPPLTALVIYTGSMEFLMADILLSSFNPLSAFATAVMVGARHLFYGIAMLDKYRGMGWKKFYLIYTTSDETFAVNYSAEIPEGVDKGWFYLWVSFLDQMYWVAGSAIGAGVGSLITINMEGLDFVMTAMFMVILLNQWMKDTKEKSSRLHETGGQGASDREMRKTQGSASGRYVRAHASEIIGVLASVACLLIFGADHFIVPAMVLILVLLTLLRKHLEEGGGQQ